MQEWGGGGRKMRSPIPTKPKQLGLRAPGVGSHQRPKVKKNRDNIQVSSPSNQWVSKPAQTELDIFKKPEGDKELLSSSS